ncbi:MAG: hypothetical protein RBT74_15770 [Tenuifilaceae bacterium]|jgi:hypothetical protein|nr:hypothetical protein [Tenuifilaceae bacterium]
MIEVKKYCRQSFSILAIVALVAKVMVFCSISSNLANPVASEWQYSQQIESVDLYAQTSSTSVVNPVEIGNGFYSNSIDVKIRNSSFEVYRSYKVLPQYFPTPRICSHTGIFLCLRL